MLAMLARRFLKRGPAACLIPEVGVRRPCPTGAHKHGRGGTRCSPERILSHKGGRLFRQIHWVRFVPYIFELAVMVRAATLVLFRQLGRDQRLPSFESWEFLRLLSHGRVAGWPEQ